MAASEPRQHLHQIIDQLDEDHIPQALNALQSIQQHPLETILRDVPGLLIPARWPPHFLDFAPLPVTASELPSDQLIRERR